MRVLFISRRFWPHLGGVEKHLAMLCDELGKDPTTQITIVTEQDTSQESLHEKYNQVEIWRIPKNLLTKKQIWLWWWRHQHLLLQADVTHIHDVFFWLLPFRSLYFWKRWFMTFHGYEPPGPPNWRQRFWHQLAGLLTEKNICIGGFHQRWYGVEPSITSFGAVDSSKTKKSVSPMQSKTKKLVFIGRLEQDTGITKYVEALRLAVAKGAKLSLEIFGEGELKTNIMKQVHRDQLQVTFHPPRALTSNDLEEYSLCCVSGYLTILEALAAGRPVLSTYHSQLKKDYLLQTPFHSWIQIAEEPAQLAELMTQSQRVSSEAVQWARSQSPAYLAQQYQSLWKDYE